MPGPIIGAALSAVGNVAGSLLSGSSAARNQREMLRYNAPVNQVRRLRQAGLNPALAMTNGMMDSGNASAPAQAMPQFETNSLADSFRSSVELRQQKELNDSLIYEHQQNGLSTAIRNKFANERNLLELENLRSDLSKKGKDTTLVDKMIDYQKKVNAAFDDNNTAQLSNLRASASKLREEAFSERVNRYLNWITSHENIRLSRANRSYLASKVVEVNENVNQMKMNGVSQRRINSYIEDTQRETARKLHLENENFGESFKNQQNLIKSQTGANSREHKRETFSFFGIPLGTTDKVYDVSSGYLDEYDNFGKQW